MRAFLNGGEKMKKILAGQLVILLLAVGIGLGFNLHALQAQENASFHNVMPFSTIGGFIGFFDQKDGMVYIYDDQMKEAIFIYKLSELGQPSEEVKNKSFDDVREEYGE